MRYLMISMLLTSIAVGCKEKKRHRRLMSITAVSVEKETSTGVLCFPLSTSPRRRSWW